MFAAAEYSQAEHHFDDTCGRQAKVGLSFAKNELHGIKETLATVFHLIHPLLVSLHLSHGMTFIHIRVTIIILFKLLV